MWHAMQNSTTILRFVAAQTFDRVEGCRAADIVMGRTDAICKLLTYVRDKFDLDYLFQKLIGDIGLPEPEEQEEGTVQFPGKTQSREKKEWVDESNFFSLSHFEKTHILNFAYACC